MCDASYPLSKLVPNLSQPSRLLKPEVINMKPLLYVVSPTSTGPYRSRQLGKCIVLVRSYIDLCAILYVCYWTDSKPLQTVDPIE